MSEEIVAITGGSGFLAQHLIAHLQRNHTETVVNVTEIRTIDRNQFVKFLGSNTDIWLPLTDFPITIPQRHFLLDICDENALQEALYSVTTVFHCAGKSLEYLHDGENHADEYWHDNTDATEVLVQVIHRQRIPRLVFVSDAYACLPVGDNYGLSEQVHTCVPQNYMLGIYGESKTRAELFVRKAANKGQIQALILRPTFIYGEGEKHLLGAALKLCSIYNGIPYLQDDNRGNHQYIYAGNMAAIMERAMICLRENPDYYSGEVVICLDCTQCKRFVDFMEPFLEACGMERVSKISYTKAYFATLYYQILSKFSIEKCLGQLTLMANKFLNCWSVGFSNRKLRLFLDFIPPYEQLEAINRSVRWYRESRQLKITAVQFAQRSRTG